MRREGLARHRWWRALLALWLPDHKPWIVVGEQTRKPAAVVINGVMYAHPAIVAEIRRRLPERRPTSWFGT